MYFLLPSDLHLSGDRSPRYSCEIPLMTLVAESMPKKHLLFHTCHRVYVIIAIKLREGAECCRDTVLLLVHMIIKGLPYGIVYDNLDLCQEYTITAYPYLH